jgi:drug/metabolite transporter (DMT)-like permease
MTRLAALVREGSASTSAAFLGVVVLGGLNAIGIRALNAELAPLWGAALRFGIAAVALLAIVALTRTSLPRGRALTGSMLYGLVGFAGAFGFIHWAIVHVPPATAQTVLALVPLLTLLFAVGQGLEQLRATSLVGALVAFAGVGVIFGEGLGAAAPLGSLLAVVAGAACMAESNVIVKRFPKSSPLATNAIAMTVGATVLLVVSIVAGEPRAIPSQSGTWLALAYVSLAGSVAVFTLFVYLIGRMRASAASFVMLLLPLVTIVATAVLGTSTVTPAFFAGGALVLGGVYIGAIAGRHASATRTDTAPVPTATGQPGCA